MKNKFGKISAVVIFIFFFVVDVVHAQKLVLRGKTSPSELTIDETLATGVLICSDEKVIIQSFSMTLMIYGRMAEVASSGDQFSEEMREALELLKLHGQPPKEFTIEKVVAWKDGKKVEFEPLTVRLKE